jgi:hypothetical protein
MIVSVAAKEQFPRTFTSENRNRRSSFSRCEKTKIQLTWKDIEVGIRKRIISTFLDYCYSEEAILQTVASRC